MAGEKSRKMSVLKIHKKDDPGTFVKLRVIDEITFVIPEEQYQEYVYKFDNSSTSKREVDVVDVDGLSVERIIKFNIKDDMEQGQEYIYTLLVDPKVHKTTHTKKIYKYENGYRDESTWIKVERIDELRVIDPDDQYQETIYKLEWPDLEIADWDEKSDGGTLCEFPIRLDPFQNIIEAQLGGKFYIIAFDGRDDDGVWNYPFQSYPDYAVELEGKRYWRGAIDMVPPAVPMKPFGSIELAVAYNSAVLVDRGWVAIFLIVVDAAKLKTGKLELPIYGASWQDEYVSQSGQKSWPVPAPTIVSVHETDTLEKALTAARDYTYNNYKILHKTVLQYNTSFTNPFPSNSPWSVFPIPNSEAEARARVFVWGETYMQKFTTLKYNAGKWSVN